MKRHANAVWQGTGKEGQGSITTQTKALDHAKYSYTSRFEDGPGTNPEELIAAAHAGCFTMKLSFNIDKAGFKAENLETNCAINFEGGAITGSHLIVKALVPGLDREKFNEIVEDARLNCPISKLLHTDITVEASLVGGFEAQS